MGRFERTLPRCRGAGRSGTIRGGASGAAKFCGESWTQDTRLCSRAMIPLRDINPTTIRPVVTHMLIALNVASFLMMSTLPTWYETGYSLVPSRFSNDPLGEAFTLVTSQFLHANIQHIVGNLWFLYIFGDNVEDAMGFFRFILFYILCGFGAVAAQLLANPSSTIPMVGASGAIGGVMGGYALLYPKAPVHMLVFFGFFITRIIVPAYFMLGFWFLLQFISAIPTIGRTTGGVAFWAHIGGFLTGIVLVRLFCAGNRLEVCRNKRGRVARYFERLR